MFLKVTISSCQKKGRRGRDKKAKSGKKKKIYKKIGESGINNNIPAKK
jgi:hypothetical protein